MVELRKEEYSPSLRKQAILGGFLEDVGDIGDSVGNPLRQDQRGRQGVRRLDVSKRP